MQIHINTYSLICIQIYIYEMSMLSIIFIHTHLCIHNPWKFIYLYTFCKDMNIFLNFNLFPVIRKTTSLNCFSNSDRTIFVNILQ